MLHRYGLISDTHGRLHPRVFDLFEGVEAIFHAGDVVDEAIITELGTLASTYAVCGNCDPPGGSLPPLRMIDMPFGRLILTHSHLQDAAGRDPGGLVRHFLPRAPRVIVYGHSHRPYAARHEDIWVVNPGSAGKPRFHDHPCVAILTWNSTSDSFIFQFEPLEWKGL